MSKRILITGGAGFIGTAVIRQYIEETDNTIINLDKLTYAGNMESLGKVQQQQCYHFEQVDLIDRRALERVVAEHRPDAVMHLAAESHVDRSISNPDEFIHTNIIGTYNLLEVLRIFWSSLKGKAKSRFMFHHVSTDEVYGDLAVDDPPFKETSHYAPSSPYSASKASSDHLVRAWHRTFDLPVVITNSSNNYGPYQFPEKLIPLTINNALELKPLPIYGKGDNIRDWIYVEDHAQALRLVLEKGQIGETYNIGGQSEKTNLEVVRCICEYLNQVKPDLNGSYERLINFVSDRPGHDRRYAIDTSKIEQEIGWIAKETFETGIQKTVQWYLEHPEWIQRVKTGAYREWIKNNYSNR